MTSARFLCTAVVLLLTSGHPALGRQELPRRGSLAELGDFDKIIDLSERAVARMEIRKALVEPGIQYENVPIHAYTPAETCGGAALWRSMANDYGALVLTYNTKHIEAITGEWFNQLDNACNPNGQQATEARVFAVDSDFSDLILRRLGATESNGLSVATGADGNVFNGSGLPDETQSSSNAGGVGITD